MNYLRLKEAVVVIILFMVLGWVLVGCGSGMADGTSAPTPPQPPNRPMEIRYEYWDYAPYLSSRVGVYSGAQWVSTVISPVAINITWQTPQGPAIEEHRIREYAGRQWVFVDAYDGMGGRNAIRATRVEINEGAGWQSLPPTLGNPYIPVVIAGQLTVRQWGWVYPEKSGCAIDDAQCGDGVRYFWQQTITPNGLVTNACWHDAATMTRDTLLQQEAWWAAGVWLDRSTPGEMKDGIPTGEHIQYTWFQTMGKGAGYLWTGAGGICLMS